MGLLCRNVPYDWINKQKSNQHWLKKEGDKFLFPGGGTMFPNGVGEYVDRMQKLIPGMKDGTIRTAIDTGCAVSLCYLLCVWFLYQHYQHYQYCFSFFIVPFFRWIIKYLESYYFHQWSIERNFDVLLSC